MRDAAIDSQRTVSRDRAGKARKRSLVRTCLKPVWRLIRAYPARAGAGAAFGVLLSGIVFNAVFMQKGHHPAPLFGPASPAGRSHVPAAPSVSPAPRPAAAPSGPPQHEAAGQGGAEVEAPSPRRLAANPGLPRVKVDGITQLLRGDKIQSSASSAKTGSATVLEVQRALRELGYQVNLDGHMGAATRQALDKFGRDRHLSVDGDFSPALLRELGLSAGPSRG